MQIFTLESVFKAFQKQRVLIIGDVMLDSYIWGNVDRISPEAPVPVINIRTREKRLGGAGNVAVNCQALGAIPILVSVIGKDPQGDTLKKLMKASGLETTGIIQSDHRVTTVKERILADSQQVLRIDDETTHNLEVKENNYLLHKITALLPGCDLVIFEDYDKGILSHNNIQSIIQLARSLGIPTIVDPKRKNFLEYKNSSLFKPNFKEIKEGLKTDIEPGNMTRLKAEVMNLIKLMTVSSVMITLSEYGLYFRTGNESIHVKAHKREIADVSGAGDTVVSIAGLTYALGLPSRFIAELSNLGGGLVCEHPGVVPVDRIQLLKEARKNKLSHYLKSSGKGA
jgi:D-glycero-beta-D-manno-heptose-7-phosphate kinase